MSENKPLGNSAEKLNMGTVSAVRGSVVDVLFPARLPPVRTRLEAGQEGSIVIEVVSHQEGSIVRGIALSPTKGLGRGAPVVDSSAMLHVPVGKQVLGRMFNVFGETIDDKTPLPEGGENGAYTNLPPLFPAG